MSLAATLTTFAQLAGADIKNLIEQITKARRIVGEVREYGGSTAPSGWAKAEGQILNIADRPALFAVIGNLYGGDGVDTFALPDFRNRTVLGSSTTRALGTTGGSDTVSIVANNLPVHSHNATLDLSGVTAKTNITVGTFLLAGQEVIVTNNGGLTQTFGGRSGAAIYLPANTPPTAPELLGGVNTILNGTGSVTVNDNTTSHDSVNILPPFLSITRIIYLG